MLLPIIYKKILFKNRIMCSILLFFICMNILVVIEGGDVGTLGRGAMRGRRLLPEIITKPTQLVTKKGL